MRTASIFQGLSPEHPTPCPSPPPPPPNTQLSALQSGSSANLSAPNPNVSYVLRVKPHPTPSSLGGRGPRGLPAPPSPASSLPPLLSPRVPTQACQQAGRKLLIAGRVGHFHLTLNNPGLGYKEPGSSARSPCQRHHPPQSHSPDTGPHPQPGPSLPQGQGIPLPAPQGFLL